jgi:catalase
MAGDLSEALVGAINDISGVHPGYRAAHAKGVLYRGTFTGTPEAAELTRAAHVQGDAVPATIRFSNGGGDPTRPDGAQDGRGMAVKFYLPDGSKTDIVALTLPVFFVRTAEDCLEFTRLRKPDPKTGKPDLEKLGAYLGAHPEAQEAIQFGLAAQPPASYAQLRYYGIHSFRFVDADDVGRFVRYRWEPVAGEASISPEEAKQRSPDYLGEELRQRVSGGPVAFELHVVLAAEGDAVDDPTERWPDERRDVLVGRLEITGPETEREQGDDVLVFDPTRVTDGIETSNDPILHARPGAYSVSVERRSGVRAPT